MKHHRETSKPLATSAPAADAPAAARPNALKTTLGVQLPPLATSPSAAEQLASADMASLVVH